MIVCIQKSLLLLAAGAYVLSGVVWAQDRSAPTGGMDAGVVFRAGIDVVTLSAAVRDGSGQVVRNLERTDFQVLDTGIERGISDFHAGDAPVSLGVLLDISGSMALGDNIDRARGAVDIAMGMLSGTGDEAALYTFDATLAEAAAFTQNLDAIRSISLAGQPWGATSLYDAIGAAAERVAERANRHRALLVITDGVDTASSLNAAEVSSIASAIDVPVYIVTVATPRDLPEADRMRLSVDGVRSYVGTLADLARWTGGHMKIASTPDHAVEAIGVVFAELRHQYVITFESGAAPGWHPIQVRTHDNTFTVHARSGYVSGPSASDR
ncbi:MAG: VWA domain-containing protein [Acidobacteria bacterium]|nr:VWA domain-containing protein [Acidobacteriota bacterium]